VTQPLHPVTWRRAWIRGSNSVIGLERLGLTRDVQRIAPDAIARKRLG
jgi:hypothetical protein